MVSYLVAYTKYAVTLEAQFILFLQNLVGERNAFLQKTSKLSDPAYAIAILFPVFASLDSNLGGQLLLVSAVTEWTNTLLKWSLMEGRPYWWVREERVHVPLRQSETTCETGPGSPSAHVMGAAAFLYVFIRWFRLRLQDVQIQKQKRANVAMWIIFSILITLVSLSRMNIATHFPHQCVLGCILGILVSKFLTEDYRWAVGKKLSGMGKSKMLMLAIFISSASAFFYWMQQLLENVTRVSKSAV